MIVIELLLTVQLSRGPASPLPCEGMQSPHQQASPKGTFESIEYPTTHIEVRPANVSACNYAEPFWKALKHTQAKIDVLGRCIDIRKNWTLSIGSRNGVCRADCLAGEYCTLGTLAKTFPIFLKSSTYLTPRSDHRSQIDFEDPLCPGHAQSTRCARGAGSRRMPLSR